MIKAADHERERFTHLSEIRGLDCVDQLCIIQLTKW
jgi:hypothetical protein